MALQESIPTAEIERRAKDFLAQGKFRKARDEFKVLSKLDKARYLPFLIEANKGLMLEMLSKGLKSEAEQVLSYLKTITTPEQWKGIQLSFACACAGDSDAAADPLALLVSNVSADASQRRNLADKIILGGSARLSPDLPASEGLCRDAMAVRKGLEAISSRDFTGALDAIRPLAHDSVFSHWKLFIKGLAAFHTGDFQKANRFFEALPPHTAPCAGARPYVHLGSLPDATGGVRKADAAQIPGVLSLLGIGHLKDTLIEADGKWMARHHAAAFQLLKVRLGDFPSEGNDWKGVLSQFCFNSIPHMSHDEGGRMMRWLEDAAYGRQARSAVERMMFARMSCLCWGQREDPSETLDLWAEFIEMHGRIHGNDPIWTSEAYLWLGGHFAEADRGGATPFGLPFGRRRDSMYDAERAIESLEKSAELNPANLEAHLALCGVFKKLKRKADLNRWRDVMSGRFPGEKSVLIEAGCGCIDRRAYVKGIEYLERAMHLDRLDARIPNLLIKARLFQARQYAAKGNIDKARLTMGDCEELLIATPGSRNYLRARWVFHVQEALLEADTGNKAESQAALDLAFQHSPFPAAVSFFAEANPPGASSPKWFKVKPEWRALLSENFTVAQAFVLLEILYFLREENPEAEALEIMAGLLEPFLKKLQPAFQARADLVRLMGLIEDFQSLDKILGECVSQGRKLDPGDPLFQIYDLRRHDQVQPYNVVFDELQKMLAVAQRRQDEKAIRLIQEEIQEIPPRARHTNPYPYPDPDPQGVASPVLDPSDQEDLEDDDFEDGPFNGNGAKGSLSMPPLPPFLQGDFLSLYFEMNATLPAQIKLPEEPGIEMIVIAMTTLGTLCHLPDEGLEKAAASLPATMPAGLPLKLVKAIRFWRSTGQFGHVVNPGSTLPPAKNGVPPRKPLKGAKEPPKANPPPAADPNQLNLF